MVYYYCVCVCLFFFLAFFLCVPFFVKLLKQHFKKLSHTTGTKPNAVRSQRKIDRQTKWLHRREDSSHIRIKCSKWKRNEPTNRQTNKRTHVYSYLCTWVESERVHFSFTCAYRFWQLNKLSTKSCRFSFEIRKTLMIIIIILFKKKSKNENIMHLKIGNVSNLVLHTYVSKA